MLIEAARRVRCHSKVFWPTTVLWNLKVALYTPKADTAPRVLVEVRNTSCEHAFPESFNSLCGLRVPIERFGAAKSKPKRLGKRSLRLQDLSRVRLKALACLLCAFAGHLWLLCGVLFFLSVSLSAARSKDEDRVVKLGLKCIDIGLAEMAKASDD